MNWNIKIEQISLGGYTPAYWENNYPAYGNKNMAGRMQNCDLTDPTGATQGPGLTSLSGTVDQTIKGISPVVVEADTTYGFGGTKVYSITSTSTSVERTIAGASGEDVAHYAGELFYAYDTDIGKYDLSSTWDDDWWTAVAGGSALTSGNPHPMVVAGTSGVLWIANGQYVAEWDGSTATDDAFNTHDSDSVIQDLLWNNNYLYVAANKPDVSGRKRGSVYVWDGTSPSWTLRAEIQGEIGGLYGKGGTTYVFYKTNVKSGVCQIGYIDGNSITPIEGASYDGSLPEFYQITEYKGFIIWASGTSIFAFGTNDNQIAPRIFQLSACGSGGLANPFGSPITASSNKVEKYSGYTATSNWKSILFDITGIGAKSMIDELYFNIDKMSSGAQVDWSLVNNQGTTVKTGTISYSSNGTNTNIRVQPVCKTDNFRLEFDWTNGSTSNPVKIKSVKIKGHTLKIP